MHRWKIYLEDEQSGQRTLLGELHADSMSEALCLAAQYYERDSGDLVAIQVESRARPSHPGLPGPVLPA